MSEPRISGPVRVEHIDEPLGIGTAAPRLSWRLVAPAGWQQREYEIEVQRAGSEARRTSVMSADQVLVPWPTLPLRSRERVEVRVRATGIDGSTTPWSEPTAVEAGLLASEDWVAVPVGGAWPEEQGTDRRPSRVRKGFVLDGEIAAARLYASAHGVFRAELNGTRVGDDELSPGWTSYNERLRYRTYDVTGLVATGPNMLGAWLGDGWYRGRLGYGGGYHDLYGTDLSLIAQLEVEYTDGRRAVIATDGSWEASPSPILFSGLYDGERHDLRLETSGWSDAGANADGWTPVREGNRDPRTLVAPVQQPVRCVDEVEPVEWHRDASGALLLDFGQNLVGRLRIRVQGSAGDEIRITHAEVLQDGDLYRRTLRLAASEDVVTLAHDSVTEWEPRFTIHGFRYARIEGWTGEPGTGDIVARVLQTDMRRTGWFSSSDASLNRLHENVLWSTRSNFVDIPTDCPQRDERLGWTGDIQVFAPTATYLYDCAGMLDSWLVDLANEQLDDGTVPWFVPVVPSGPPWEPMRPGAVWGDAAVLTPWVLHERFGDSGILAQQYASAKAWGDLIIGLAGEERLWNEGFQLGDWLDPAAPPEDPADGLTDKYVVSSAYLVKSTRTLAAMAAEIGLDDDAAYYAQVSEQARQAFVAAYVRPDGTMTSDAQTAYALAIVFDLVRGEQALGAGHRLAQLVRNGGNLIGTGFAGTPVILDALTMTGHADAAYDLILERKCPSWLYMVDQGATTIWERWDSMLPDGTVNPGEMTSFNHFALGAVADWMHRDIAGLAPTSPGYRTVRIQPTLGGGLTSASGSHESPYGMIDVSWTLREGTFTLDATLPTGVSGDVHLPDGQIHDVSSGAHRFVVSLE